MSAAAGVDRTRLRADCSRCFALCCVALPFGASADFAIDKPAGTACRNLAADLRCTIHDALRPRGFAGCVSYDCHGAGQHVSQVTFGGRDWRADATVASRMFAVFPVVRRLHELLALLAEVLDTAAAGPAHEAAATLFREIEGATVAAPHELEHVDVATLRSEVGAVLERASALVRGSSGRSLRGADLAGRQMQGARLARADLRGAVLIAADLRGADLRGADLLGSDLRDADLRGADLRDCLFLGTAQLHAARGDAATRLSPAHVRPAHWTAA